MPLAAGIRLGPYEIQSALGRGGMGEVYRALDTRLNRTVAIKVLASAVTASAERRERFVREARAAAALSHPHICALYDFGRDNDTDYLVMEYLEGETLAEQLFVRRLPLADVLRYAIEISDALDHAHRQGFVHRDLKPENVMVTKSGTKLLDFGLAKSRPAFLESGNGANSESDTQSLTAEGSLIGTLHYVASIDGPDRTRVLSEYSQAIYVPPGYLVFHHEGTLFARPFDAATLKLSGDPFQIASDVAFNPGTGRGVFAASNNGIVAYRAQEDRVLGWFDRAGKTLGTIGPPGRYRHPALAPDEKTVAVAQLDPSVGTEDIWLLDADGGAAARFTFDPAWDNSPAWSPDGTRIVFASNRSGRSELYVKALGSASEDLLLSVSSQVAPAHWSRDGRFILFLQMITLGDLWMLPLVGERKPFLVAGEALADELLGHLSPDGRWLAYTSNETGTYEVYVRPATGTSSAKWRVSDHGGVEPTWRRDGKELFYIAGDQQLMAVSVRAASNFENDPPTALFETRAAGTHLGIIGRNQYDVAPDGRRFLINAPAAGSSKPITVVVNWTALLPR